MAKTEDWAWPPIEVACETCGAANAIHEHPEELLVELAPNGVKWECNACGAVNRYGVRDAPSDQTSVPDGAVSVTSGEQASGTQVSS